MIVIWSVIGVLAVLCAAAFLMHLRFEGATPADVPSAKAAGDTLLALRDTTVRVARAAARELGGVTLYLQHTPEPDVIVYGDVFRRVVPAN